MGLISPMACNRSSVRFALVRLTLIGGGILLGFVLIEIGLRVYERIEFGDRWRLDRWDVSDHLIADSALGHRLQPFAAGSDANGFRNETVPSSADIITIGDSFTWGYNAYRSDAWPQTLARLTGRSVYNMSMGGYGPVQYWVLAQRARSLVPRIIIVALYLSNDIYDAYQMVYTNPLYADLRDPAAPPEWFTDAIAELDQQRKNKQAELREQFQLSSGLGRLFGRSAIVRLLRRLDLWPDYEFEEAKFRALATSDAVIYVNGNVRTVIIPGFRGTGIDLEEPRIAEGFRITQVLLRRIQNMAIEAGIQFLVLLIPTKALVYAQEVRAMQGSLGESYEGLVRRETRVRSELVAFCDANGIRWVDGLPTLQEAVRRNEQIYPVDDDGHLGPRGYYWLAASVAKALTEMRW